MNVFWKHLPSECYDKTDTYGNKDLTAASRAVQILDRALKTLAEFCYFVLRAIDLKKET